MPIWTEKISMFAKAILPVALLAATGIRAQDDVAMRAMKDELARTMQQIQMHDMEKPYFVSYRMDDLGETAISASLGSLTQDQPTSMRMIGVEVRVGSASVDNTNYFSSRMFAGGVPGMLGGIRQAPLDDNYSEIRRAFWLATDSQYKKALEDLTAKRAAIAAQNHTTKLPDFSMAPVKVALEPPIDESAPMDDLKKLAKDLSAVFKSMPDIYDSSTEIEYRTDYARYVNSEGSSFMRPERIVKLKIEARAQAADELPIADSIDLYGHDLADLPPEADLIARTKTMAERILKLRSATSLERYNGPVLFEGEAAPEIFAQAFASGLTEFRTPISDQPTFQQFFDQMMEQLGGRSFEDKIGGRVLPSFLSVSDSPLISDFHGLNLMGSRSIDDDAVATRETKLVERGYLKTLLATRVPSNGIAESTGSRRGWGPAPSNLLVTNDKPTTDADMRKQLLQMASDRGLKYGIIVKHVGGGSAAFFARLAARMMQQGAQPGDSMAEVYKLYPDGHEELVQGIQIAEMTAAPFRDIVAAGDTLDVYTDEFIPRISALFSFGISSASQVPVVSYVAPSLLFEEMSLVKTEGPFPNPPIGSSPLAK
jgi:predicted Zn-dependent protease